MGADVDQSRAVNIYVSLDSRVESTLADFWAEAIQASLPKEAAVYGAPDQPGTVLDSAEGRLSIDPALAAKARTDRVYRGFVDAIASACASPEAESLEMASCRLFEKRDLERHSWLKMILHVDFVGGDFGNKRGRRIALRRILDERISAAERDSDDPVRTGEIDGRFFITVRW